MIKRVSWVDSKLIRIKIRPTNFAGKLSFFPPKTGMLDSTGQRAIFKWLAKFDVYVAAHLLVANCYGLIFSVEVLFLPLSASNVCRFRHFYRIHRQVFSITRIQPIQIWIIRTLMKTLKTLFTITLPATNFANHQLEFE